MAEHYIYKGGPVERVFGPVPEGDWNFIVAECGQPEWRNEKWIMKVKLIIEPSKAYVWDDPWSGTTSGGEERDGIGIFLASCNRAPKPGTRPDWRAVVGARGRLRLKQVKAEQGKLAGQMVNKVHYYYRPHELAPETEQEPQSYTEPEVKKATSDARKSAGPVGPDLVEDPDDIPFGPNTL